MRRPFRHLIASLALVALLFSCDYEIAEKEEPLLELRDGVIYRTQGGITVPTGAGGAFIPGDTISFRLVAADKNGLKEIFVRSEYVQDSVLSFRSPFETAWIFNGLAQLQNQKFVADQTFRINSPIPDSTLPGDYKLTLSASDGQAQSTIVFPMLMLSQEFATIITGGDIVFDPQTGVVNLGAKDTAQLIYQVLTDTTEYFRWTLFDAQLDSVAGNYVPFERAFQERINPIPLPPNRTKQLYYSLVLETSRKQRVTRLDLDLVLEPQP